MLEAMSKHRAVVVVFSLGTCRTKLVAVAGGLDSLFSPTSFTKRNCGERLRLVGLFLHASRVISSARKGLLQ